MKVGIPKSLLYYKYYPFIETFFQKLGAEIVLSRDTNKEILNNGTKYCVDEACLPMKVFHGHVFDIKDKCGLIFIPRVMSLRKGEFICPKFCGLPEMVKNSVPGLPKILDEPVYCSNHMLRKWAFNTGKLITGNPVKINRALKSAIEAQISKKRDTEVMQYPIKVALAGHPYNVNDSFINMNLIKKLNSHGIGVVTEENVDNSLKIKQISSLYKRPFWTFAREIFGFSTYLAENRLIDGIVYVSSFGCGIDSVIIELIKNKIGEFPFLILKIDEETGEAGFDTRIEAFSDMLERRRLKIENNIS
ncbi:MAG: acyl-CoA dehydratase activase-related protein [Bacillota bacterium]|nr:acyl-CoA dehydratase activase-related protein [Bacillota bacterium]